MAYYPQSGVSPPQISDAPMVMVQLPIGVVEVLLVVFFVAVILAFDRMGR